jgi:hypothetical protein
VTIINLFSRRNIQEAKKFIKTNMFIRVTGYKADIDKHILSQLLMVSINPTPKQVLIQNQYAQVVFSKPEDAINAILRGATLGKNHLRFHLRESKRTIKLQFPANVNGRALVEHLKYMEKMKNINRIASWHRSPNEIYSAEFPESRLASRALVAHREAFPDCYAAYDPELYERPTILVKSLASCETYLDIGRILTMVPPECVNPIAIQGSYEVKFSDSSRAVAAMIEIHTKKPEWRTEIKR